MFVLDLQSRTPIYEQMKHKITELVRLGILAPDEQLPSVRSLARDLGVNPNTVQKAYQELERDGLVYSVSGRGSFVAASDRQMTALLEQAVSALTEALWQARRNGVSRQSAQGCLEVVYAETQQGGLHT